jgi:catechol 2,3-dioxygenase-like lactoylglutathione lyase family enzyme
MSESSTSGRTKPGFTAGRNIAMKVPPHQWEATVQFYRDVLGFRVIEHDPAESATPTVVFEFGANQLWIDRVDSLSQAEIWLEVSVDDIEAAASYLDSAGIVRRDEIEPLGDDFTGFWISNPAAIIHLVAQPGQ